MNIELRKKLVQDALDEMSLHSPEPRVSIQYYQDSTPVAIFDVDGTLEDGWNRLDAATRAKEFAEKAETNPKKAVQAGKKAFFKVWEPGDGDARLINTGHPSWVSIVLREYHKLGVKTVIFSGRSSRFREPLMRWLSKNDIPFDDKYLFMRGHDDFRPDNQVKADFVRELEEDLGYRYLRDNLFHVFDDNPSVVGMWEAMLRDNEYEFELTTRPFNWIPRWFKKHYES